MGCRGLGGEAAYLFDLVLELFVVILVLVISLFFVRLDPFFVSGRTGGFPRPFLCVWHHHVLTRGERRVTPRRVVYNASSRRSLGQGVLPFTTPSFTSWKLSWKEFPLKLDVPRARGVPCVPSEGAFQTHVRIVRKDSTGSFRIAHARWKIVIWEGSTTVCLTVVSFGNLAWFEEKGEIKRWYWMTRNPSPVNSDWTHINLQFLTNQEINTPYFAFLFKP